MTDRTFAFVDLAGFTALTEVHGDDAAVAMLARFRRITSECLGPDDVFVKTIGDAVMLAFADPSGAVSCLRRLFDSALADSTLPLMRAGAHHGPAIEDGNDFFGATVNLAARVAANAAGGHLSGHRRRRSGRPGCRRGRDPRRCRRAAQRCVTGRPV